MPHRSPHAKLGDVKQFHEDFHLCAEEAAADRVVIQNHAEQACNSIDLGRMSNENMPNEVMVNILTHLTEPVMPHYQNLDGKAASYFLRLFQFRTPTYEIEGELYGECNDYIDSTSIVLNLLSWISCGHPISCARCGYQCLFNGL